MKKGSRRPLVVWNGMTFDVGKQVHTIVATRTKKAAMEILRVNSHEFNNYWGETGNPGSLQAARTVPEGTPLYEWGRGRAYLTAEEYKILQNSVEEE